MLRPAAGALLVVFLLSSLLPAQTPTASTGEQKPKDDFFSGTISAMDDQKVTVTKNVLGKNSETRVFLITKDTRIEGKLKLKVRVTVRFTHDDDGNRAVRIIVRTTQKK